MRKIIAFFSLALLLSCSHKDSKELYLFNNASYQMQEGEFISTVRPKINDLYRSYFNNQSLQVPLFKYIHHSRYNVFIGIPYNTSIGNMINAKKLSSDCQDLVFEFDSHSFFKKYYKNRLYICEYATSLDKGTIYLALTTGKKEISDSLFSKQKISKRIQFTRN